MASVTSDFDPLERLKDSHEVLHARHDKLEDLLVELLEKMASLEAKFDEKFPPKKADIKVKD